MNDSVTTTNASSNTRLVIRCPQASNFTWDLDETTLPSIVIPITLIAALAVIILNALVVLAFQKKRELKKTSTILLSSMAIADLLVGAISMPLNIAANILINHRLLYSGFCTLRIATEFSMFTFILSSLYHLTFIAWERYVAIRKWIDYQVIVTKELIKTLAILAWLLAAFTSFPPKITEISQVSALVQAKQEIKVAKTTGLITAALILSFVPVIVVGGFSQFFVRVMLSS